MAVQGGNNKGRADAQGKKRIVKAVRVPQLRGADDAEYVYGAVEATLRDIATRTEALQRQTTESGIAGVLATEGEAGITAGRLVHIRGDGVAVLAVNTDVDRYATHVVAGVLDGGVVSCYGFGHWPVSCTVGVGGVGCLLWLSNIPGHAQDTEPVGAVVIQRVGERMSVRDPQSGVSYAVVKPEFWPTTSVNGETGDIVITADRLRVFTPTFIAADETFTVPADRQVLYALPIDVEGVLEIDGALVVVDENSDITFPNPTLTIGGRRYELSDGYGDMIGAPVIKIKPNRGDHPISGVPDYEGPALIVENQFSVIVFKINGNGDIRWPTYPNSLVNGVQITSGGFIKAGNPVNPPGGNLGFGFAGSVNGEYGLFSKDVHSLDTVYGSQGVVVGFGRQNHTHDGSLWLATKGSVTGIPTAGSQETRVYTDESGTHFQNNHAFQKGSTSTAFDFDDVVKATGFTGSGSGLSALPAGNLTGTLPAISGVNLTSLNATNLGSGTVADARLSANVPRKNVPNAFSAAQTISYSDDGSPDMLVVENTSSNVASRANLHLKGKQAAAILASINGGLKYFFGFFEGQFQIYGYTAPGGVIANFYTGANKGADLNTSGTGTIKIGTGATGIKTIHSATASLDFPSIGANLQSSLTMTVTGAAVGDSVQVNPSSIDSGLTWSGYVSAANTVQIRVGNMTALAIDPVAATWRATVMKF